MEGEDKKLVTRGLFIGDDVECFSKAAALSIQVNFTLLDEPLQKVGDLGGWGAGQ